MGYLIFVFSADLYSDSLEKQKNFSATTVGVIQWFLSHLDAPVCLIADYGNGYDFRLLKAELNAIGQTVSEDIYCVDSIDIFRSADCMISVARNRISPQPLNWFRCYHTRCDNRHRILSRWFQLDYWFFGLANQTQRYINFEYRKINNHCFSSKSIFNFFLPFENNIIKSISYGIIQNNQ